MQILKKRAHDTKARTSYWTLISVTSSGDFQDVALQVEQLASVSLHDCPFRQRWSKVIYAPNKFETSEVDQAAVQHNIPADELRLCFW